jgi:3-hydroxyacyl-[acyl-carrier-protein] dehydratase
MGLISLRLSSPPWWAGGSVVRFSLIDRITELHEGERISAVKVLTLAEEYLKDHFPRFPVMPGVMMLEALFQASAWLVRKSENFEHSIVVLRETRNAKYSDFVEPGQTMTVKAEIIKQDATTTTLKAQGMVEDRVAVSARLILERFNLADRFPERAPSDEFTRRRFRRRFEILHHPATLSESTGISETTG